MNLDICNEKQKIDLTKSIVVDVSNVEEEVKFCKEELIDCHLVRIVKKEPVSYAKLIFSIRKELGNLFVPSDDMLKKRLKRLIDLEYINEIDTKYEYVV